MKQFVLDASAIATWLLNKRKNEADNMLALLKEREALVPSLWHLETRNALIMDMRRRRRGTDWYKKIVGTLVKLPVHTDTQPELETAFNIAVKHRLTFYDAIYLELAERHKTPLATFDKALASAATAEGLPLLLSGRS